METIRAIGPGLLLCALLAAPCYAAGLAFPVVGGPVFGILLGMLVALAWRQRPERLARGIQFTSKKVLQYAVILLGFGLNLMQIAQVGVSSLPVILSTIATSLIVGYAGCKLLRVPGRTATLVAVGSSICGGSAIAATAPVIKARDDEVAQSISVIFLFNVIAALVFPTLGTALGLSNEGFGLFAGTAVNDTSSVTAAAAAWDGMHPGANTLDQATIVKLTRTLAIIPITLVLALWQLRVAKREQAAALAAQGGAQAAGEGEGERAGALGGFSLKRAFPMFILWFLLAACVTTACSAAGLDVAVFAPLKTLSKYFIVMAMLAIGLNTNLVELVRSGGKPIALGACCWVAIAVVSLLMQYALGTW
ncbi:MAG: YeiH family protein [Coriobacteriales bacterium]